MIVLHRFGHPDADFQLNPEMIQAIEALPDTTITLATGAHIVVSESPDEVAELVREYRIDILSGALRRPRERHRSGPPAPLGQLRPRKVEGS